MNLTAMKGNPFMAVKFSLLDSQVELGELLENSLYPAFSQGL